MVESLEDLKVQLDILQDEVDLIKNQIKQNLVDLREYIMNRQTIFPVTQGVTDKTNSYKEESGISIQDHANQVEDNLLQDQYPEQSGNDPFPNYREVIDMYKSPQLDTSTVGSMIWWLGTIKRRGLSLRQFAQFLEAYETSGLLDHSTVRLVKVMIRAMEDAVYMGPADEHVGTSEEYAECLLQFSEIFCPSSSRDKDVGPTNGSYSAGKKPVYVNRNGAQVRYE